MKCAATGYRTINGTRVYYKIEGEGPPMVFVHGWSLDLSYWDAQVEFFSKNYRTYRYDWHGMGKSGGGEDPFTMKELGEELDGFMKSFGVKDPVIVGHSEGGAIALRYAASNPGCVTRLVLADTALNTPRDAAIETLSALFVQVFSVIAKFEGKNPLVELAPTFEHQFYSEAFINSHPDFIKAWNEQFISNSPEALVHGLRAWAWRINIERELKRLKAPALLLWGTEDVVIKLEQMQRIQRDIPNTQLSTLAGSGHMTPVEVPEQFNTVMNKFLN